MWFGKGKSLEMPTAETALPGRDARPFAIAERHVKLGNPLEGPYPEGLERVYFGMGCFWGAERLFWEQPGVWTTAVGYGAGHTAHPTYGEVCTGKTGHNELVLVVFDPKQISFGELLQLFFERHDPTQGMRQGNDVGTQYRSGIYPTTEAQLRDAEAAKASYDAALNAAGKVPVTTEIVMNPSFYFAEDDHQQYLAKNPWGYCGLQGTGVACALPASAPASDKAGMTAA